MNNLVNADEHRSPQNCKICSGIAVGLLPICSLLEDKGGIGNPKLNNAQYSVILAVLRPALAKIYNGTHDIFTLASQSPSLPSLLPSLPYFTLFYHFLSFLLPHPTHFNPCPTLHPFPSHSLPHIPLPIPYLSMSSSLFPMSHPFLYHFLHFPRPHPSLLLAFSLPRRDRLWYSHICAKKGR